MTHIGLPILYCLLVDFPDDNKDCDNDDNCFQCDIPGKYLFGGSDSLKDHGSAGHTVCLLLWISIVVMGVFGICANCFVISVLKKRNKPSSFDFLLYVLASFDLITSLATLVSGTGVIFYLENWDCGLFTLASYYFSILLFFFGKSGSAYMTVFITIERYLVISNPVKSRNWFTPTKIKCMTIVAIVLAILFNIPRASSGDIEPNLLGKNLYGLNGKDYIIIKSWEDFWYKDLMSVHSYIDCFAPFPLLIIFNVLLFVKISRFVDTRQKLTKKQKSDIRAARMFVPVVIVLFLCNAIPLVYFIMIHSYSVSHRELFLGMLLSVAVNSAVNLPIYYARGGSFRVEMQENLPESVKPWFKESAQKSLTDLTVVTENDKTGSIDGRENRAVRCDSQQFEEAEEYFFTSWVLLSSFDFQRHSKIVGKGLFI